MDAKEQCIIGDLKAVETFREYGVEYGRISTQHLKTNVILFDPHNSGIKAS